MHKLIMAFIVLLFAVTQIHAQWNNSGAFPNSSWTGQNQAMAVDPDGKIWVGKWFATQKHPVAVGDTLRKNVYLIFVFNPDGTQASFSPIWKILGDTLLTTPRGMRLNPDGNILFANSASGTIQSTLYKIDYKNGIGIKKIRLLATPTAPAVSSDGTIFIAPVVPGSFPLSMYDQNFNLLGSAVGPTLGFSRSFEVSKDGNTIYWAGYDKGKVFVYNRANSSSSFILVDSILTGIRCESFTWHPINQNQLWMSAGSQNDQPLLPFTKGTWYAYDVIQKKIVDSLKWKWKDETSEITKAERPRALAFSPDGLSAYIGSFSVGIADLVQKLIKANPSQNSPLIIEPFDFTIRDGYWDLLNMYNNQGSASAKLDLKDNTADKKEGFSSLEIDYAVGAGEVWGGFTVRTSTKPFINNKFYDLSNGTKLSFWYKVINPIVKSSPGSVALELKLCDIENGTENRLFRDIPVNLDDASGQWKQIAVNFDMGADKTISWAYQAGPVNNRTFQWNKVNAVELAFVYIPSSGGNPVNTPIASGKILIDAMEISPIDPLSVIKVNANPGWNLISLPSRQNNMNKEAIFKNSISFAFGYNNGYETKNPLQTGKGYWLKYSGSESIQFRTENTFSEIELTKGWNLLGISSKRVLSTNANTTPAGILQTGFYGYSNGYFLADTLKPTLGYWVLSSAVGKLLLNNTLPKTNRYPIVNSDWAKLRVVDARGIESILYIAKNINEISEKELPPLPPIEVFDARWITNRLAEDIKEKKDILISSALFPIRMSVEGVDVVIKDKINGQILNKKIRDGESLIVSNSSIERLEISLATMDNIIPVEFELHQNYPNPFNPTTKIKFSLPQNGRTKLTVYNSLGEKVTELIYKELNAGYHEVEWNASSFSSGVYYYELKSNAKTTYKKMLLIK